jgi:hypothetical protein
MMNLKNLKYILVNKINIDFNYISISNKITAKLGHTLRNRNIFIFTCLILKGII